MMTFNPGLKALTTFSFHTSLERVEEDHMQHRENHLPSQLLGWFFSLNPVSVLSRNPSILIGQKEKEVPGMVTPLES